jgi:YgiT-type zinc finger domain-containing protein
LFSVQRQTNEAKVRRVPRPYGRREELVVVEDVPVVSCPSCGESYLTAETARHLDRVKRLRRDLIAKRPVAVTTYA